MTQRFQFDVPSVFDTIGKLRQLKAQNSNHLAMSATLMAAIIHLEDYARLVPRQLGLPLGARPQLVPKSPGHRKVGSTATIPEGADDDGTTPVPEA